MSDLPRIAIVQNRIGKGGRLHVIVHTIKLLNKMGIVPDIVTQKMRLSTDEIQKYYKVKINYNLREIFIDLRLPYEWHIVLFNFLTKFYCKDYDLIINNNNTSFLGPRRKRTISYVHYPRIDRNLSKNVSIHFPEGPVKRIYRFNDFFNIVIGWLYRLNKNLLANEIVIANSRFTKKMILKHFPQNNKVIDVIYPPVINKQMMKRDISDISPKTILHLGRFTPDKRQLELIKIAGDLPDYLFYIVGFAKKGDKYLQKCKQYIEKNKLENVIIMNNVDFNKMQEILRESYFFIHNTRNEPFGITTVQAIAMGCIPIVHNSGGQKEIVPIDTLRFDTSDEIVNIIRKIDNLPEDVLVRYRKILMNQLDTFSEDAFETKMKKVLSNYVYN